MDKNAIKKFAVWARTELIARVSLKGVEYGITEGNIVGAAADSINGKVLTDIEKKQRQALIVEIHNKGYKQVMEEVAYTWFNRFSALRFMEVNGYLPSHVRVFTDVENNFKPQIITEAIYLELDGLDKEKVFELKDDEKTEELYKYLLIIQCNALNKILPGMFQKISDYTELLLPDNLLRDGSVIQQMIELIPEDDWKDAVQIIGWLYQYYNSEKKDDVFAALKKRVKITKENIPAATQLFTPDWIVRYMVENSLGRLWLEGHPDVKEQFLPNEEEQSAYAAGKRDLEDTKWHYYLEETEQEPDVQTQLVEIRKEYAKLTPEQLKVIDPCCGSGHILTYMFDVLIKIYESYGYTTREAVESIVENNIYGLDIDDRAAQLAYFAVMMKARQYDRRFFSRGIQPHVYVIVESNHVEQFAVEYFCNGDAKLKEAVDTIISELHDAKEYGSILTVTPQKWTDLYERFAEITVDINIFRDVALTELLPLVQVAEALAQKYDAVVTNPPYMGNMSGKMTEFVQKNYAIEKYDLYAVFMKRCRVFAKENGYISMITQQAWLFLSSFEKFREDLKNSIIVNLVQLGAHAFEEIGGEIVQTVCFTLKNTPNLMKYQGMYKNLIRGSSQDEKEKLFFEVSLISNSQNEYEKIPGTVIAYWIPQVAINLFEGKKLSDYVTIKSGIVTGDNDYFLKLWYEIKYSSIEFNQERFIDNSNIRWVPMHKGGGYRKHYGLHDYVMNLHDIWEPSKTNASVRRGDSTFYFKEGLTWSTLSNKLSVRRSPKGFVFDTKGSMCFPLDNRNILYLEAFLNSEVASYYMSFLSPTLDFNQGAMGKIPLLLDECAFDNIQDKAENNCFLCKNDWDSFEISWDFQYHPFLRKVFTISEAFNQWQNECVARFNQLKANEEKLNRIFIDIYGLQDELTPEIEDKDVTVRKADLSRDIRSFISYAVGCMFGRYSIYKPGLIYAGGDWNSIYGDFPIDKVELNEKIIHGSGLHKYGTPITDKAVVYLKEPMEMKDAEEFWGVDADNIIPICDDEYFADDIVGRFIEFVRIVYGESTLDENLKFIANVLGGKGHPKEVIRNYFLKDFYKDHCKIYQKRPIYWLFDSGKKNGFKALIYMHRYQPDTIARIRTDYVHEQQARYCTAIADLEQRIVNTSTSERVKLNKKLTALKAQDSEIRLYEEKIHHLADQMISIDLDDGVKRNYAIFQDVLAKIK